MKIVFSRLFALFFTLILVVANAILIEIVFDSYNLAGHRSLTGIIGTGLVIFSFGYSIRKRKILFKKGNIKTFLQLHEWLGIAGTVIIFVHTGTHLRNIIPLLTLILMIVTFISGLIGRYVYLDVKNSLRIKRDEMKKMEISDTEIEEQLARLIVASNALGKWRDFHMPLIWFLALMIIHHTISVLYYGAY